MGYYLHRAKGRNEYIAADVVPREGEHVTEGERSDTVYAVQHIVHQRGKDQHAMSHAHVYARGDFKLAPLGDD